MEPPVIRLLDNFVVEVGQRQAWPFVGFCNNSSTPPAETRLYIDSTFTVGPGPQEGSVLDTLNQLNGLTVDDVRVVDDGGIVVVFEDGLLRLMVSGRPTSTTAGPPWWLGTQH